MNIKNIIHRIQQTVNCPLTRSEIKFLKRWDKLYITSVVARSYRYEVKNNRCDSIEDIKKKLTRNMILGNIISNQFENFVTIEYGNLILTYSKISHSIVGLVNRAGKFDYNVDGDKKQWIDNYLNI